jgi:ubiquinone biosynthesis protein UbiJ
MDKDFEEKLKRASNRMLAVAIIKCIEEIKAHKDKIAELEKRIEALEGNKV